MREFKLNKWVAAGLMAAMPYSGFVDAAGLGRLNVLSQLGQPFSAEIDLVNVTKEELATLKAALASPTAYQAANLTFNPSLNALRLSIERRPDGAPFIRAISFRPVAEPFLDLLIELSWQGGKIVREYSALLDPPGMESPAAAVTAPVAVVPQAPAAAKSAPASVAQAPIEKPAPAPVARPAPTPTPAPTGQVSVKYGDTLTGIANSVKPEGISLEQALIGLFRANPDAFTNSNINQLRAGKILNVPEREQLAAIAQGDAAQVVRVHATNWNSYRQKVADTAPAAPDAAPSAKGKITARVEDKASAGPRDVVVLSKGEPGGVAAGKGQDGRTGGDRLRALEEDLAARDKALTESRERVAQLEKTLKELQKLGELKSPTLAAAAQQAAKGTEPVAKPDVKPAAEAPTAELAKAEGKAPDAPAPVTAPTPLPVPKKAVVSPLPPPEAGLMDTVMDNIVPIGGGALALLAGIGGLWALRRRRKDVDDGASTTPTFKTEPFRGNAAAGAAALAPAENPEATVSSVSDVVDPIDEAQVYIDHGRDAQAEEILKEAMGKNRAREDIPLKLLEVYAARGDRNGFNAVAMQFHALTGGTGENWDRAAAMGHALDPANPFYPSDGEVVDIGAPAPAPNVDLDIGGSAHDPLGTTTDILLDQGDDADADMNKTMVLSRDDTQTAKPDAMSGSVPDFNIELPNLDTPASVEAPAAPAVSNMMEFNIDLPAASGPAVSKAAAAPVPAAKADDGPLDFKVDFSGINLNLDDAPAVSTALAGGAKDAHWEDVQQKFDLARAYQEMGDKEGAVEILHEVEREGDADQKAEAQKMMQSLK